MTGLVEVVGDWFVPVVFDVSQVFLKMSVKDASSFAEVDFGAFGAMDDVHDIVRQAVELFGDVHFAYNHIILTCIIDDSNMFCTICNTILT